MNGSGVLTPVAGTTNRFGPDGQPPWYGERLDLDHAIYVCFANARTRDERERDPDGPPRGRVRIYEPEDCDERWRQHLEHTPRRYTGPTLIPIQV